MSSCFLQLPGAIDAADEIGKAGCNNDQAVSWATPSEQVQAFKKDMDATLQKHWQEMQAQCENLYHRHFQCEFSQAAQEEGLQEVYSNKPKSTLLPPIGHSGSDLRHVAHANIKEMPSLASLPSLPAPAQRSIAHLDLNDMPSLKNGTPKCVAKGKTSIDFGVKSLHTRMHALDEPEPLAPMMDARQSLGSNAVTGHTRFFELEMEQRHVNMLTKACDHVEKKNLEMEHCNSGFVKQMTMRLQLEHMIDAWIGFLIFSNAIIIGFQMDAENPDSTGWVVTDIGFSVVYCFELGLKVSIHGLSEHFCGKDRFSHIFDACLVFIDLLQLFLDLDPGVRETLANAPSAALFRVVRLAKITRILRLLRSSVFKDLLAMIQGMAGGMQTLAWSMVLFVIVVYVVSLIFRVFLGRKDKSHIVPVYKMFESVPRSMLTTFRCSFGDCSTPGGSPVFEHVAKNYPWMYPAMYCFFLFIVTIGLFNVISAIFLEATMAAARRLADEKKQDRLNDEDLWFTRIYDLMSLLCENWNELSQSGSLGARQVGKTISIRELLPRSAAEVNHVMVPWQVIEKWSEDKRVRTALSDLDIDPHDSKYLYDILDPDNNGKVTALELLDGLRRLRGFPRRSDVLTVDLMVRSIQRDVNQIRYRLDPV